MLWYLVPSVIMFAAGVYGFCTRKNMIALLISLERPPPRPAETAIAISIIINIYREVGNTDINSVKQMRF